MDHLTRTRPSFQQIVDKQRVASHRLNQSSMTRSETERGHYQRSLQPVPVTDVELPRLPLVRFIGESQCFALLCEIAQQPGRVILLDLATSAVRIEPSQNLELLPPNNGLETAKAV